MALSFAAARSQPHPDAVDWMARVIANNGTFTLQHFKAVNEFCRQIDSANLRRKILRCNLFAGSNLNAALVPVFRGAAHNMTQYGNSADTAVGLVSGDYTAAGGLVCVANSRYVDTTISPSTVSTAFAGFHQGCFTTTAGGSFSRIIGAASATGDIFIHLNNGLQARIYNPAVAEWTTAQFSFGADWALRKFIVQTFSPFNSFTNTLIVDGVASTPWGNGAVGTSITANIMVGVAGGTYMMYSIGDGFLPTDNVGMSTAISAYMRLMGRT